MVPSLTYSVSLSLWQKVVRGSRFNIRVVKLLRNKTWILFKRFWKKKNVTSPCVSCLLAYFGPYSKSRVLKGATGQSSWHYSLTHSIPLAETWNSLSIWTLGHWNFVWTFRSLTCFLWFNFRNLKKQDKPHDLEVTIIFLHLPALSLALPLPLRQTGRSTCCSFLYSLFPSNRKL